jgi:DNA helicase-2/ATP-dependent DNA helicase PcrA
LSQAALAPLLLDLSEEQRAAVTAPPGPVLIVAGAGSGKTRALTHRIAHLVASGAVAPREVLAITFTNRAAEELADRVAALVGQGAADAMTLGTFHAVCHRVVRPHAERLGRTSRFSIYDGADARRMVAEAVKAEGRSGLDAARAQRAIALAKARLRTPADLRAEGDPREALLATVWERTDEAMAEADALDFDDLVTGAVRLLEDHSDLRKRHAARWGAVLVDEVQDLSPAQYRWLWLIGQGHGNVTVVGDDDQAIYRFRGADPEGLRRFRADFPGARVVVLGRNFRSSPAIVRSASFLVARNRGRIEKRLWSVGPEGPGVRALQLRSDVEEGRAAAAWCGALIERAVPPTEIGLLFRARHLAAPLEAALLEAGIAHRLLGGRGLLEAAEIREALAHLTLLVNPRDRVALARGLAAQTGAGPATVGRVIRAAAGRDLLFACAHAREAPGLRPAQVRAAEAYGRALGSVARSASGPRVAATVGEALLASGLPARLSLDRSREGAERLERVRELVRAARAYERSVERPTLIEFLAHAALQSGGPGEKEEEGRVTLATVHAAKGLEWRAVRVIALEEGSFPNDRALAEGALEEERRLAYVAMTRARERLALSHALWRRGRRRGRSRFIAEAGVPLASLGSAPSR